MEGNRRNFLNKRSNPQFKKTGGPRKRKQHNSFPEGDSQNFHSSDTVYHILCQSKRIGSVIGKGGNVVKSLREETQAKITVSDSVSGSDERVISISSPSDKQAKRQSDNNGGKRAEKGDDVMEPRCAAQDALLRVHDRIVEEDLGGSGKGNGDEDVVSARLLVSKNMVGCLLGRGGDVIQRLRSETGANIRVLSTDNIPAFAMGKDELVQISGKPEDAKKALYEVSTLLHQKPRKDKPPSSITTPYASQGFHSPGPPIRNMLPPGNSSRWERTTDAHRMQHVPFRGGYGMEPSTYSHEDFDRVAPPHDREAPSEFTIKVICSAEKIGGVIGKGGSNVKQLEHETGASIHVENVPKESDERVIRVTSYEVLWDERSQTIDAILHLQKRISEYSEEGTITTRLLVPTSKVGCLLGQGGYVINDMRRRTHADIRVSSKEEKPKCASEDEELVQISGSFGVAKDALVEIASRLRTRCLHDANARGEPASVRPLPRFSPGGNLHDGGLSRSSTILAGGSKRYEHFQGSDRDYESPSFSIPPRATRYWDANDEAKFSSVSATSGSRSAEYVQDPYSNASRYGTSQDFDSSRNMYHQAPASSYAGQRNYPQRGAYESYNSQYRDRIGSLVHYENPNRLPAGYRDVYTEHGSYQNARGHGSNYY